MEALAMPKTPGISGPVGHPSDLFSGEVEAINIDRFPSLGDLTHVFTYFTPALMCLVGNFPGDPVRYFANSPDSAGAKLGVHQFDHRLFDFSAVGEKAREWENKLFFCDNEHWPNLEHALRLVALADFDNRILHRTLSREFTIIDPVAMGKSALLSAIPYLNVRIFTIASNLNAWGFIHGELLQPPKLVGFPPSPVEIELARQFFAGDFEAAMNQLPLPAVHLDPVKNDPQTLHADIRRLRAEWQSEFGDLSSPETQARIERAARMLREQAIYQRT